MQLPKELTTVTPLSKAIALLMFIFLPILAFLFGMRYQTELYNRNYLKPKTWGVSPTIIPPAACTYDAKICPDGSAVGRIGPNCEFEECPTTTSEAKTFTGPIRDISYTCHMDGICSIAVGKAEVVIAKGESLPGEAQIRGSFPVDLLDETKKDFYVGKQVEVYAASPDGRTDSYTLYGSKDYYVKLIDEVAATPTVFCGGIAGKICPTGYDCKYDGRYPDAGGTCIKDEEKVKYTCPDEEYVNCMPGPGVQKDECTSAFLDWAQSKCPNFKGAAY